MENKYQRRQENNFEYKRESKYSDDEFIFGVRAVIEAIKANRVLNKIFIQKGMKKELFLELKEALKGEQHQLQFVPVEKLDGITDQNHQGVVALVSPIEYFKVEEIVEGLIEEGKKPFILVLDRITDVRNFGAIARTAECEGVDAIVILANFAHNLEKIRRDLPVKHVIVTQIGDFLGGVKGMVVNLVVKHVKKMVPEFQFPQTISFRQALERGRLRELATE